MQEKSSQVRSGPISKQLNSSRSRDAKGCRMSKGDAIKTPYLTSKSAQQLRLDSSRSRDAKGCRMSKEDAIKTPYLTSKSAQQLRLDSSRSRDAKVVLCPEEMPSRHPILRQNQSSNLDLTPVEVEMPRALIAEFIATLLFLYVTVATVIGYRSEVDPTKNTAIAVVGVAWAFGVTIFILLYCMAGISGGHINPAVTFGLFLARKVSLIQAVLYMVAQCLGAICGVGLVKGFHKSYYDRYGGGANELAPGYDKGTGLGVEIIGTFVLVYTVFSATNPKRNARDSHVPVLAPLPIGFAVFMVHLATIPITGTGINPARSFGAAVIYNKDKAWDDQWIFWVGPFIGAAIAAAYHQYILRVVAIKALGSFRSNPHVWLSPRKN